MAFLIKDRVRETASTTGTGAFALAGAVSGYQAFSAVCSTNDTFWYSIVLSATSWETGLGTYSGANTLTRTTVLESSNSGSAVNFAAGTKDVFIGFPSSKMAGLFDATGAADQVRWNTAQSLTTGQQTQAKSNLGLTDGTTGGFSAGDAKLTYKTAADTTWVMMDDGTIGDASSGASTRANADTADAYAVIWAIGSAASIPILTSAGAGSTYGASAAADFAAHKRLTLPRTLGRALVGAGTGSGLTAKQIGGIDGADTVTIGKTNLPAVTLTTAIASGQGSHFHSWGASNNTVQVDPQYAQYSGGGSTFSPNTTAATLPAMVGTTPLGGSGTALSIEQASSFLNVMLKL